jgi:hypothetical protein
MYRSFKLEYKSNSRVSDLPTYRYSLEDDNLISYDNGANQCFCESTCINGLLDISSAKNDLSIFLSQPYFSGSDESVYNAISIEGTPPQLPSPPLTYLDVEPYTGFTIRGVSHLQINVNVKSYEGFNTSNVPVLEGWPDIMFPIVWYSETTQFPVKVENLMETVVLAIEIVESVPSYIYGVGGVLVVISFFVCACYR